MFDRVSMTPVISVIVAMGLSCTLRDIGRKFGILPCAFSTSAEGFPWNFVTLDGLKNE